MRWLVPLALLYSRAACSTAPCAHGETRNSLTGECACLLGYKGKDCETAMFPACRSTTEVTHAPHGWPPAMPCRAPWGTSCECLRQCFAERNRFTMFDVACYERADNDTAAPSLFPAPDEAGVTYWSSWRPETRKPSTHDAVQVWERPVLPLSACPGSCSHEGVCLGPNAECVCANGLSGPSCEVPEAKACFMNCSARGDCVRGVCICDSAWFGMGCTEPVLDEATIARKRSSALPPRHKLAIYVWELPPYISLQSLMDNDQRQGVFPGKASSFSEFAFLHSITEDTAVRVRTPWEANMFLLPTFSIGVAAGFGGDHILGRIKRIIGYLRASVLARPFWDRYGGANMMFWTAGDLGGCTLNSGGIGGSDFVEHEGPENDEALKNVIIISECVLWAPG